MINIILIAPPAAGKGTQSELLNEKYNFAHISTGDLLRAEAASGSERGKYIGQIQASGGIVDDDIVLELLENKIKNLDNDYGYVLDGFPRTINQAEKYEEIANRLGKNINFVLFLDIEKDRAMKRTLGRLTCPSCKAIYNVYSSKFDEIGLCNVCHSKLEKRNDDTEEIFANRFDSYMKNTQPLIEYYIAKGLLHNVQCCEEKEDTFAIIESIINR